MSNDNNKIVPYQNEFNSDLIKVDDIIINHNINNMNTGDILLFSGYHSIISSIIKWGLILLFSYWYCFKKSLYFK